MTPTAWSLEYVANNERSNARAGDLCDPGSLGIGWAASRPDTTAAVDRGGSRLPKR
jgi:hypothetical protein